MTTENYSMFGLKDLLNDLEHLSTCLMSLPEEHVDSTAFGQLKEDQLSLIHTINSYATMLCAINSGNLPD